MKKNKTNADKVMDYMNKSPLHALIIMEGAERYAKILLAHPDETKKQFETSFFNGDTMLAAAKDWKDLNFFFDSWAGYVTLLT